VLLGVSSLAGSFPVNQYTNIQTIIWQEPLKEKETFSGLGKGREGGANSGMGEGMIE